MLKITSVCLLLTLAAWSLGSLSMPVARAEQSTAEQPSRKAAAQLPGVDPVVEDWLERIEQRSEQIQTFQARVRYDRIQGLLGDEQRRFGQLTYVPGPPAKVAVHFDAMVVDGQLRRHDRWYVFDGMWLVERDDQRRQFIKRQVVDPNADPTDAAQADPLRSGGGPFVLPITQQKQEVLDRFEVTLLEPADDDSEPANAVHFRLTPRRGQESQFTRIDLWYDRDTLLPLQARTVDASENESFVVVIDSLVNEPVSDNAFDTSVPRDRGWTVEISPFQ